MPPTAAIIVIPEIFGVNPGIRQKCDKWAELGFLAVAPDVFWRFAPGVELNPDVQAELEEAFGYYQQYDPTDEIFHVFRRKRHGAINKKPHLRTLHSQQLRAKPRRNIYDQART